MESINLREVVNPFFYFQILRGEHNQTLAAVLQPPSAQPREEFLQNKNGGQEAATAAAARARPLAAGLAGPVLRGPRFNFRNLGGVVLYAANQRGDICKYITLCKTDPQPPTPQP